MAIYIMWNLDTLLESIWLSFRLPLWPYFLIVRITLQMGPPPLKDWSLPMLNLSSRETTNPNFNIHIKKLYQNT